MNFSSNTTSLAHRASIAAIASLWNQPDIIVEIKDFILRSPDCKTWRNIEKIVIFLLKKILLPKEIKVILNDLVQPMGTQIFKFISLTESTFQTYSKLPESLIFIWTERGTLDYCKTVELIIESCSDKQLCYYLACIFCMEETIQKFWPHVRTLVNERINEDLSFTTSSSAVMYWTYYLNDETETLMLLTEYCGVNNSYELGFSMILDSECVPSLSYFLKFLEPERKHRLVYIFLQRLFHTKRPLDGNVVVFLFSHLTEYDIDKIVRENCYCVLSSLLEWPCHEFFMPIANSSWNSLLPLEYLNLLQDLAEFVSRYDLCEVYKILAVQFWQASPTPFKEYIKNKCLAGTFLSRLFLHENTEEIIQIIFNYCTPEERTRIIFYFEGFRLCDLLVKKERWDSLELLVKNCIHDTDILQEFIKEYKSCDYFFGDQGTELRVNILVEKLNEWYY